MKDISLQELYVILEKMKKSDYELSDIKMVEKIIKKKELILEDTSATGGPAGASTGGSVGSVGVGLSNATTAGMGGVVSSQPSAFPGALNGTAWASGGGTEGSGDIAVPYNPSGSNRMFQKIPFGKKRKESDPNKITKKYRTKPIDMKSLRDAFKDKKSSGKIMNFDNFIKKDITTKVTKVKEGKTEQIAKKGRKDSYDILRFQDTIESHIKSLGGKIKKIGNDFELHYDSEHVAQIMFREDYIGVKKIGNKFPKEFKYSDLGKIKSEIKKILE